MSDWKEKIVKEHLGGKTEWTDAERLELGMQLNQDIEDRFDKLIGTRTGEKTARAKDAWTEENWQEKMAEHPIFAPYVQEGNKEGVVEAPDNALTEGLSQLKFGPEHNSPLEVAQNYKDEGVHYFKEMKYKLAVMSFTEGLRAKCSDSELLAQLLNNRAAAYFRLGNFRAAIRDCEQAVLLKPDYRKAMQRAAESADKLGLWDELIKWADRGLGLDPSDEYFVELRKAAVLEKNKCERISRKKVQEENQKLLQMRQLLAEIEKRGIKLEPQQRHEEESREDNEEETSLAERELASLPHLEPCHPAAVGSKVHQNKAGDLVWPVLLVYPEYQQTDFIQHFNEKHTFVEQLEVVFGDGSPPPPWDRHRQYTLARLALFYEDRANNALVPVRLTSTLGETLAQDSYVVQAGTPSFIIAVAGSKFISSFLTKYK